MRPLIGKQSLEKSWGGWVATGISWKMWFLDTEAIGSTPFLTRTRADQDLRHRCFTLLWSCRTRTNAPAEHATLGRQLPE